MMGLKIDKQVILENLSQMAEHVEQDYERKTLMSSPLTLLAKVQKVASSLNLRSKL